MQPLSRLIDVGGTIASVIQKYGKLNETLIKVYTRQILEGLEYLHARNVIHRGSVLCME